MLGKHLLGIAAISLFLAPDLIQACDSYPLTENESRYLKSAKIDFRIPEMRIADDPPKEKDAAPRAKDCFLRSDFDGDGVEDFVGIHQNSRSKGDGHRWVFDLVLIYSDGGEKRHSVFPGSGRADMDEEVMHHFIAAQPPGTVDLRPGEVKIDHPGIISYRYGAPAVLYYWDGDRFTLRNFYLDD